MGTVEKAKLLRKARLRKKVSAPFFKSINPVELQAHIINQKRFNWFYVLAILPKKEGFCGPGWLNLLGRAAVSHLKALLGKSIMMPRSPLLWGSLPPPHTHIQTVAGVKIWQELQPRHFFCPSQSRMNACRYEFVCPLPDTIYLRVEKALNISKFLQWGMALATNRLLIRNTVLFRHC